MIKHSLLILHVAEECLSLLGDSVQVTYVRVSEIHTRLQERMPAIVRGSDYSRIRIAMRFLFPIHKNLRRRTKRFKLRVAEAETALDRCRLRLRPLSHIRSSYEELING